ncbi:hypothetical protein CFter6_1643 [Collimonas fungivorans]|uniref:Uncharacterized protein n=1 Tax=Collimonas fungivorans TaxID=158899 RepID=A0A127P9K6_9BURK|nr:hypothetical protein CFter6_1643 [Collimonas fungivorans]
MAFRLKYILVDALCSAEGLQRHCQAKPQQNPLPALFSMHSENTRRRFLRLFPTLGYEAAIQQGIP